MSTPAQIAANQHNAPLSKGAMSQEGRDKVRFNALSHGLTSKQVVLPGEDQSAFDKLLADMMREYAPVGIGETSLVTEVVEHYWRMNRAQRQETALWNIAMAEQLQKAGKTEYDDELTHDAAMAKAFCDHGKDFDRLRRYSTTIERSYYKALNALYRAQKERRRLEQQKVRNELTARRAEIAAQRVANATLRLQLASRGRRSSVKIPDTPVPPPSTVSLQPNVPPAEIGIVS